jgi:hypothetical protein
MTRVQSYPSQILQARRPYLVLIPLKRTPLRLTLNLPANIGLGWKWVVVMNVTSLQQ